MKRHYEFTGETKRFYDKKLYRIRATEDLPLHEVKQGELGGWIEKYENLAVYAWVADEAKVFGNARVSGNLEEFKKKVIEIHGNNKFSKEYLAMIKLAKIKFDLH